MSKSKLAIDGGPRTVRGDYLAPIGRIRKAAVLTADLLSMWPRLARGKTTIGDGSKIIKKFENAFKDLVGADYALAMNSGTATLHSAYFAVGVGPGHEVIVPSYTWHASATPIIACGATPVFCDVDPCTLTIDPDDFEARITERTKAVCVVHSWGNPAEMDRITEIAKRHKVAVVEDCSHAHGGVYKGKALGTWGSVGCFSLNASKAVDAGEGGIAVTDDPVLYDHMLILGHFGRIKRGFAADTFDFGDMSLGHKYRPHQLAMHLAYGSLKRLGGLNKRSTKAWNLLSEELRDVPGIRLPEILPGAVRAGFQSFVMVYEGAEMGGFDREKFVKAVRREGAPLVVDRYSETNYTYGMLHRAPLFTELDRSKIGGVYYDPSRPGMVKLEPPALPVSERVCKQLVSLPRLDFKSRGYVRSCGRAIAKVLWATVEAEVETPAMHVERPVLVAS